MQRKLFSLAPVLLLATLLPAAVPASGPGGQSARPPGELEWEAGVVWWESDYKLSGVDADFREPDAGDLGFRGEIWLPWHFGFVGQYLPTDTAGAAVGAGDVTYTSVDVLYRVDTVSRNNYLAIGAGWEFADLAVSQAFGRTDGPRGVAMLRMGSATAFGYAGYSYMWKMSRIDVADTLDEDLRNIRGDEYEFGGGYILGKHAQLRLGYRRIELRMERADGTSYTSRSAGYVAGLAVVF